MIRTLMLAAALSVASAMAQADLKAPTDKRTPGSGLRLESAAPKSAPASGPGKRGSAARQPDPKRVEAIAACMVPGLPADWKRASVVVEEIAATRGERTFEANFYYDSDATKRKRYVPQTCSAQSVARSVYDLNEYLPDFDSRQWTSAELEIEVDGRYAIKYDYTPRRPAAATK